MLADAALWVTQYETTGALRTSHRAAGLIIAAAVLADLITLKRISVTQHHVIVLDPGSTADPDSHTSRSSKDMAGAGASDRSPRRRTATKTTAGQRHTAPRGQQVPAQSIQRPDVPRTDRTVAFLNPLYREVMAQIAQAPDLSPAEVIVGLADDIRTRVARRLIIHDRATPHHRWRAWHRELVAVAKPDDLQPLAEIATTLSKIIQRYPLTTQEMFLMQLVAPSSLGNVAMGHIKPATIDATLGRPQAIDSRYRPLLLAAITLLRDLPIAH